MRIVGLTILLFACSSSAQEFHPHIPRVWDDNAVKDFEIPLVQRDRSPRYMSAEEYYQLKIPPIYRTWPIYAQAKEPPGYLDSLKDKEPEIIFDPAKLHSKDDWIKAGKLVFEPGAPDARWPRSSTSPRKICWQGWNHSFFCGRQLRHPGKGRD